MVKLIIDTDIGTDVDDCLALAMAVTSPELQLQAVTCVYGDVSVRAQIAGTLLRLAGRGSTTVALGARRPLLGRLPVYWAGHEGTRLPAGGADPRSRDARHAAQVIVDACRAAPGEVHVLAIGPLTNIALAFLLEPELPALLGGLTIMGGVFGDTADPGLPPTEHNIRSDPEAAHIVLSSGAPILLVPLNVTTKVRIGRASLPRIRGGATPFHEAVAGQLEIDPYFGGQGWTNPHDALALALPIEPGLVRTQPFNVGVDLGGDLSNGATVARSASQDGPPPLRVALGVDAPRFEQLLLSRLTAAPIPG